MLFYRWRSRGYFSRGYARCMILYLKGAKVDETCPNPFGENGFFVTKLRCIYLCTYLLRIKVEKRLWWIISERVEVVLCACVYGWPYTWQTTGSPKIPKHSSAHQVQARYYFLVAVLLLHVITPSLSLSFVICTWILLLYAVIVIILLENRIPFTFKVWSLLTAAYRAYIYCNYVTTTTYVII